MSDGSLVVMQVEYTVSFGFGYKKVSAAILLMGCSTIVLHLHYCTQVEVKILSKKQNDNFDKEELFLLRGTIST